MFENSAIYSANNQDLYDDEPSSQKRYLKQRIEIFSSSSVLEEFTETIIDDPIFNAVFLWEQTRKNEDPMKNLSKNEFDEIKGLLNNSKTKIKMKYITKDDDSNELSVDIDYK